jgi:hypothetical protein
MNGPQTLLPDPPYNGDAITGDRPGTVFGCLDAALTGTGMQLTIRKGETGQLVIHVGKAHRLSFNGKMRIYDYKQELVNMGAEGADAAILAAIDDLIQRVQQEIVRDEAACK